MWLWHSCSSLYDNSYPKGLIVAFTLKNKSARGSEEKNGPLKPANDSANACKPDGEPDSSDNAAAVESEQKASENDSNGEGKVEEKNELDSEDGDKSSDGSIEKGEEKEGKTSIDTYKDNMDVVMREDLKSVFHKFGTVKVQCWFPVTFILFSLYAFVTC